MPLSHWVMRSVHPYHVTHMYANMESRSRQILFTTGYYRDLETNLGDPQPIDKDY